MQVFTTDISEDLSLLLKVLSECENVNGIKFVGFSYHFVNGKLFSILLSSEITTICVILNISTIGQIVKLLNDPTWVKIGFNTDDFLDFLKDESIYPNNIIDIKNLLLWGNFNFPKEITFELLCEKYFYYSSNVVDGSDAFKILYIFKSISDPMLEILKKKFSKKPIISRNTLREKKKKYN